MSPTTPTSIGVCMPSATAPPRRWSAPARTAQRFLNARRPQEIVFVRGTTEAINLVAQTFGRQQVGPGDEVLITELEHHANFVPWQQLCLEKGATLARFRSTIAANCGWKRSMN